MQLRKVLVPEDKRVHIIPLGDIQWNGDDESVSMRHLQAAIDEGMEKGAYFIGTGDYIDFMSPSNRSRYRNARLYDSAHASVIARARQLNDEIFEILKPTRGRWLGLTEGHHWFWYEDELTTDQHLAAMLGTEFLGNMAVVGLQSKEHLLKIMVLHGAGSGQLAGSMFNKIDKLHQSHRADVYIMGHWTQLGAKPVQALDYDFTPEEPDIKHDSAMLVAAGGFSRGYIANNRPGLKPEGTYVEKGMLRPVELGHVVISWKPGDSRARVLV